MWGTHLRHSTARLRAAHKKLRQLQELGKALGGAAYGAGEAELGDVVGKKAVDVIELRAGDGLRGLHYFDRIGDAGLKPLPRQIECFPGDVEIFLRELHLTRGRLQIEQRVADFAFDGAFQVFDFGAALRKRSVLLLDIASSAAALPDGNANRAGDGVGTFGLRGVGADGAVEVGIYGK